MGSTIPSSQDGLKSANPNDLHYFIGVTIGVIILIIFFVVSSTYCCTSERNSPPQPQRRDSQPPDDSTITIHVGIDEATLRSYPKLLYSEAKLQIKNIITTTTATSCCSICLAVYNSTDMLRLLPDCSHLFHLKCVDPWLQQHPTCPICRSSSMPAPVSTSLAETITLEHQIV